VRNNKDVSSNNVKNNNDLLKNERRNNKKLLDNNKFVFNNNERLNNALSKRLLNVPLLRPPAANRKPLPRPLDVNKRQQLPPNVPLNKPPPRLPNVPPQQPPNVLLNKPPPKLHNELPPQPPPNEPVPSVLDDTPLPPMTPLYNNHLLNKLLQLGPLL